MTHVQLKKIFQRFAGHSVLDGLDLSVESGEYVVLVGPSGCGKTTTLRVIAGLHTPDQGEVFFDGKCVNRVAPRNRDVAMVFQNDGLYPHLTVGESIRFALKGKLSPGEIRSRLDQAIALTQIEGILDRYPSRLSGGELRRAAIAKSIARRTSIRLLDEPLSALDAPVRYGLQDDILRWHKTVPGTSIHVTHDGQEALRMADRIAVMEAGSIVQFATPQEVYAHPRTVSVSQAFGSPPINLIRARLVRGKVEIADPSISCLASLRLAAPDGELWVGVRPDSFQVTDEDRQATDHREPAGIAITASLLSLRSIQRDVHLQLKTDHDSVLAILPRPPVNLEQAIRLTVPLGDVHFFDAQSGRRIEIEPGS